MRALCYQKIGRSCAVAVGWVPRTNGLTGPITAGHGRENVDSAGICGVLFSETSTGARHRHEPTPRPVRQARPAAPVRHAQPLRGEGHRPAVRGRGLLRRPRPAPGPLRDGTAGERGQGHLRGGGGAVRGLAPHLLPHAQGVPGGRAGRADPGAARAEGPAHGRVGARRLVGPIEARFGVRVHPRGLEKALERAQKKPRDPQP